MSFKNEYVENKLKNVIGNNYEVEKIIKELDEISYFDEDEFDWALDAYKNSSSRNFVEFWKEYWNLK